jgi:hypothetical protein
LTLLAEAISVSNTSTISGHRRLPHSVWRCEAHQSLDVRARLPQHVKAGAVLYDFDCKVTTALVVEEEVEAAGVAQGLVGEKEVVVSVGPVEDPSSEMSSPGSRRRPRAVGGGASPGPQQVVRQRNRPAPIRRDLAMATKA